MSKYQKYNKAEKFPTDASFLVQSKQRNITICSPSHGQSKKNKKNIYILSNWQCSNSDLQFTGTIRKDISKISKYYFLKCDLDLSFVLKIYDLSLTLFVDVNAIHKIFTLLEYLIFSTQIYRREKKC